MKKLINDPELVLIESLDGFAAAHADIVSLGADGKPGGEGEDADLISR